MMVKVGMVFFLTHRAMHIKQTHISIARPNLLKEHVSQTLGLTARIKHENTTKVTVAQLNKFNNSPLCYNT